MFGNLAHAIVVALGIVLQPSVGPAHVVGVDHDEPKAVAVEAVVALRDAIRLERFFVRATVVIVVSDRMVGGQLEIVVVVHVIGIGGRIVAEVAAVDNEIAVLLLGARQDASQPLLRGMRKSPRPRTIVYVGKDAELHLPGRRLRFRPRATGQQGAGTRERAYPQKFPSVRRHVFSFLSARHGQLRHFSDTSCPSKQ